MPLVELEHHDTIDMTVYVDEYGWLYLLDNNRTCVYTCASKSDINEIVKSYIAFEEQRGEEYDC